MSTKLLVIFGLLVGTIVLTACGGQWDVTLGGDAKVRVGVVPVETSTITTTMTITTPTAIAAPAKPTAVPTSGFAPGQGNLVDQPASVTDTTQGGCESTFPIREVENAAQAGDARAEIQRHGQTCVVIFEGIPQEAKAHAALGILSDGRKLEIAVVDLAVQPDGLIEPNPSTMSKCPWGREHIVLNVYLMGTLKPDPKQVGIVCK